MAVHISDESLEGPISRRILWQVPHAGSAVIVALQFDGQAGIKLATFDPTAPDNTPMPAIELHPEEMIEVGTSLSWLGLSLKRSGQIAEAEAEATLQAEIAKHQAEDTESHEVEISSPASTCDECARGKTEEHSENACACQEVGA